MVELLWYVSFHASSCGGVHGGSSVMSAVAEGSIGRQCETSDEKERGEIAGEERGREKNGAKGDRCSVSNV